MQIATPTPVLDSSPSAPAPSRPRTVAWRSMPSVWWPWMCQLLAVEESATSIDVELVAMRRARLCGTMVEAGAPFTIRVPLAAADGDLLSSWADEGAVVMVLAGRHGRSSWVCLAVPDRRTLLEGVTTTLAPGNAI
jgi:hypothetical protein